MLVKPKAGLQVVDPERGAMLPPDGLNVPATPYWLRRKADGDVIEVSPRSTQLVKTNPKTVKSKGADK